MAGTSSMMELLNDLIQKYVYSGVTTVESNLFKAISDITFQYAPLETTLNDYRFKTPDEFKKGKANLSILSKQELELFVDYVGSNAYPKFYGALLILLYNQLEYSLNNICMAWQLDKNLNVSYKDMQGQGIERAVTYLNKIIGINNIKNCAEWSEYKIWNKVRNSLVHNNGIVKNKKDIDLVLDINVIVFKTRNLLTSEEDSLFISELNCKDFLMFSEKFFIQCLDGFHVKPTK